MTIVTTEQIKAYAHCDQQLDLDGAVSLDYKGMPEGEEPCPGVKQQEVDAIKEVVEHTFRERGGTDTGIENAYTYLRFAKQSDVSCPHCGSARQISEDVRVRYPRLGGPRGAPDQIFQDRRDRRLAASAAVQAADAQDRTAVEAASANEISRQRLAEEQRANDLREREMALRERELDLREAANGELATSDPRPRKRVPA